MKCQHEGCQVEEKIIICKIKGPNKNIQLCLNHTLMDLEETVETLRADVPFDKQCECCDKEKAFDVDYGGDGVISLCLEDLIAFVELNLSPEKFKKLYEKYPNHHMLHDDFYDEETGCALQPRQIL